MSLNQSELLKLVEDLKYVVQSGGGGQSGGGTPQSILAFMQIFRMIFVVVLYIIVAYIIYVLIFKGYPRLAYDLGTFSVFKQQNLNRMFEEHYFLLNHFKFFTKRVNEYSGAQPMILYNAIINKGSDRTSLSTFIQDLDTFIVDKYSEFKFDKRYVRAFSDHYLFYNKIQDAKEKKAFLNKELFPSKGNMRKVSVWTEDLENDNWIMPTRYEKGGAKFYMPATKPEQHFMTKNQDPRAVQYVPRPPPEHFIINFEFYELYNELISRIEPFKQRRGIKDGNVTDDLRIARIEYRDRMKGNPLFKQYEDLNKKFKAVGAMCKNESQKIINNGCNYFVMIPRDVGMARTISFEIVQKFSSVISVPLDDPKFDFRGFGDYTLLVIEVLQAYSSQKVTYEGLATKMNAMLQNKPYETRILLTAYVSLPKTRRKFVTKTLFLNYPHINITNDILAFINRYPTFSSIYFNEKVSNDNKSTTWKNAMHAYKYLMTINKDGSNIQSMEDMSNMPTMMTNMIQNGRTFKQCINSVFVVDMFLNNFQVQMTQLYEQQYRSNVQFFKELWNPFYQQIVELRVAPYFRRMFYLDNLRRSRRNFWVLIWRPVGRSIQRLRREIGKAFKRGMTVPDDPPPS